MPHTYKGLNYGTQAHWLYTPNVLKSQTCQTHTHTYTLTNYSCSQSKITHISFQQLLPSLDAITIMKPDVWAPLPTVFSLFSLLLNKIHTQLSWTSLCSAWMNSSLLKRQQGEMYCLPSLLHAQLNRKSQGKHRSEEKRVGRQGRWQMLKEKSRLNNEAQLQRKITSGSTRKHT